MNVLIIEDEKHTSSLLEEIIVQDENFTVIEKLESVAESVQYLSENQTSVDLIFLDILLADGPSFEIFKHIDVYVPVVFCTAYEEYSFKAIKNNGIDYVLKPFREDEIRTALDKYMRLVNTFQARQSSPIDIGPFVEENSYQQNFLTHYRNRSLVIPITDIALFFIEFENVYLLTFNNKRYPIFKKLDYIELVCDPTLFFRINRQVLINRNAIEAIEPIEKRKICLHVKVDYFEKPKVSRLKVSTFKNWLKGR